MAELDVTASGASCGATVRGVDLTAPLDPDTVDAIRRTWLEHHVLAFPDQRMTVEDLERFTQVLGPFGTDPFIASMPGHEHVIALHRRADETGSIFAESWHNDWSFQAHPPIGTCLFGVEIPPHGGETLFADQHRALEALPPDLRARIEGRRAVHSARAAYAPDGMYGDEDADRATVIVPSADAYATQTHPLVRRHDESGRDALYGCIGYVIGIEGMDPGESRDLLVELLRWQTRAEHVYRHRWEPNMLVVWDNRSVLHMATGGYDGHERLLWRTTIGARRDG